MQLKSFDGRCESKLYLRINELSALEDKSGLEGEVPHRRHGAAPLAPRHRAHQREGFINLLTWPSLWHPPLGECSGFTWAAAVALAPSTANQKPGVNNVPWPCWKTQMIQSSKEQKVITPHEIICSIVWPFLFNFLVLSSLSLPNPPPPFYRSLSLFYVFFRFSLTLLFLFLPISLFPLFTLSPSCTPFVHCGSNYVSVPFLKSEYESHALA